MSWLKIDAADQINIWPSFESGCGAVPQTRLMPAKTGLVDESSQPLKGSKPTLRQIKTFGSNLLGPSFAAESRFSTPETDGCMHVTCHILIHTTACITVWGNQTWLSPEDSIIFILWPCLGSYPKTCEWAKKSMLCNGKKAHLCLIISIKSMIAGGRRQFYCQHEGIRNFPTYKLTVYSAGQ